MQLKALTFAILAAASLATTAAIADDKRVAQCIEDNRNERQAADVVAKYCACMDAKMGPDEKQSVTAWEDDNDAAEDACEKESGWKDN